MHPLVEMAKSQYFHNSHIGVPLISGKASTTPEEKEFDKLADELVRDIKRYPHAFVLACLMDSGVGADRAWSIPYRVYKEVGTFEISELHKIEKEKYEDMFGNGKKSWHRYPAKKAEVFCKAIDKIIKSDFMKGDASRIWADKPSSCDVVMRFIDFDGCGFKIANMAPNILFRYFGVEFSDYRFIDIAPDVDVMRVFQRLGLIPYLKNPEIARIYTIIKARDLNPDFPGLIDGLCWEVGREFCSPHEPKCGTCHFKSFCEKKIENRTSVWKLK